mmetsp:Transcript_42085/g.130030  ORF Transcript_42085/g.130030 Transcript_42085/m.130030 type:complete len:223 (-) Transcript_42085:77-745(-)
MAGLTSTLMACPQSSTSSSTRSLWSTHMRQHRRSHVYCSMRASSSFEMPTVLATRRLVGITSWCALAATRRQPIIMRWSMCGVIDLGPSARRQRSTRDTAIAAVVQSKAMRALTSARTRARTVGDGSTRLWKYVSFSLAGTSEPGRTGVWRATAASSASMSAPTRDSSSVRGRMRRLSIVDQKLRKVGVVGIDGAVATGSGKVCVQSVTLSQRSSQSHERSA